MLLYRMDSKLLTFFKAKDAKALRLLRKTFASFAVIFFSENLLRLVYFQNTFIRQPSCFAGFHPHFEESPYTFPLLPMKDSIDIDFHQWQMNRCLIE